jgi:hypothetical protein
MVQMNMAFFGSPLGLSGQDPVGGFVAGRFEAVFFNESFQQVQRVIVGLKPIIRDSSDI